MSARELGSYDDSILQLVDDSGGFVMPRRGFS